jgi:UDP-N-acetylmuramoyl-L-alanyl-D-glutamate--2,6-diaminopimelate ligase
LTPEHIEAHGSFAAYQAAKGKFFVHLGSTARKLIAEERIKKTSIINADDQHAEYFAKFPVDCLIKYSFAAPGFDLNLIPLTAEFEKKNALAAITTVEALGFSRDQVLAVVPLLKPIAGRFEMIDRGQPFQVIVDYAYEPYALAALFQSVKTSGRIIGVHGSAGGGRDVARRFPIGQLAGTHEAIVIVTNEDPYDEDPRAIIEEVARGARAAGKIDGQDLFLLDDRRAAIEQAINLAAPGDVVLLTGKGSEPVMAVAQGKKLPWSDRAVAEIALAKRGYYASTAS